MGIRTTHVGSLPRPELVSARLATREHDGLPTADDRRDFDETIAAGVRDVVARQVEVGIDLVSDGEMSKITYSTYVKDRLTGFDGDTPRKIALDLVPYEQLRGRLAAAAGGAQFFRRESCVGPITYIGRADLDADLAHLAAAVSAAGLTPADAFMNAASPGLVTAFQGNAYFPTHEEFVEAVGEAMQFEYEAIVAAGFTLQLDCPDLAMARHTGFQDLDDDQFLRRCAHHVEVLNHATRNIDPSAMRMHLCWGNYEGPHDHDIELHRVLPIVLAARPSAVLFEAGNPRHAHEWQVWAEATIPDEKVLVPGVITSTSNYVEHPGHVAELVSRYSGIVGDERVIAGTDCGFGSFAGLGKIDPAVAYKKLAALVAGAELGLGNAAERCVNELEVLLIQRACERVIIDSAACNDSRQWAALAALYTADGVVVRPNGQRLEGRAAIEAAYSTGAPDRVTRHLCANLRVDVDGPDTAHVTTTVLIVSGVRSDDSDAMFGVVPNAHHAVGEFADELVRTDDGWRIAVRHATLSMNT